MSHLVGIHLPRDASLWDAEIMGGIVFLPRDTSLWDVGHFTELRIRLLRGHPVGMTLSVENDIAPISASRRDASLGRRRCHPHCRIP